MRRSGVRAQSSSKLCSRAAPVRTLPGALLLAALAVTLVAPARAADPPADPAQAPPKAEEAPPGQEAPKAPAVEAPKAPPPPAPAAPEPAPKKSTGGFAFGSYGRTIAATDFRGRPGRDADIVARGSRLDEGNYVELELRREDYWAKTDSTTRMVATLGITNPVFHYTGDFDIKMAVRNLYLESRDLGLKGLSVWAGSRMYRGDDVYLLDWWPLDNLNTLGGGARYDFLKATSIAIHAGVSQPTSDFYLQESRRAQVFNQVGGTDVKILDRQRLVMSAKVSHIFFVGETGGIKIAAYGEGHLLPQGQRESRPGVFETLPSDGGYVVGGQIGGFTGQRDTHLNLFFRYARGLAAYGEFATPNELAVDKTTSGAHEIRLAVGGNWEMGPVGVMLGGYIRSFRNASQRLDFYDLDEGIIALRPHVFFGEIGGLAVEGSYQAQQRAALAPAEEGSKGTEAQPQGPLKAHLWRVGVIPFLSPAGRGDYSRPQIRLIYTMALRNKAAKSLYPQDDVFSLRDIEHFFGFGAEWWFNASWSYGG